MRAVAILVACLACASHSGRVHGNSARDGKEAQMADQRGLTSLATLLLANNPAAAFTPTGAQHPTSAFQAPGMGHSRGLASSAVRRSALFPGQRAVNDPVALFSKTVAEPKPEEEDKLAFLFSEDFLPDDKFFSDVGFLIMRIAAASVMIHHGYEKVVCPDMFEKYTVDKHFAFLPGDHLVWTYILGYIQLFGPLPIIAGVFSRVASGSLVAVMLAAFWDAITYSGWEGFPLTPMKFAKNIPTFHNYVFEAPVLYMAIFLVILVAGPGKFSLAQLLGFNDDKSFSGKLKQ